jgi:hypothetical protein
MQQQVLQLKGDAQSPPIQNGLPSDQLNIRRQVGSPLALEVKNTLFGAIPVTWLCAQVTVPSLAQMSAFADEDAKPTKETKEQPKSLVKEIDRIRITTSRFTVSIFSVQAIKKPSVIGLCSS